MRKTKTRKTVTDKIKTERTGKLTPAQCHALLALSAACEEKSPLTVSYPLDEEGALHYLLWIRGATMDRRELAGALAVLPLEEDTVECIALVHPAHRRKGYFTRLLTQALRECRHYDFLFPVPEGCADVPVALKAVGAEYDHTDLLMECLMTDRPPMLDFLHGNSMPCEAKCLSDFAIADATAGVPSLSSEAEPCKAKLCSGSVITGTVANVHSMPSGAEPCPDSCQDTADAIDTSPFLPVLPEIFVWPEDSDDPIGSCRVIPLSPDCVCLCGVEIFPGSRGLGHGTSMIRSLLPRLWECGVRRIILHVEQENIPAVALYKKTGFRVTETLSYCLLPSGSRTNC